MEKLVTRTCSYLLCDFGKIVRKEEGFIIEIVEKDVVVADQKELNQLLLQKTDLICVSKKEITEKRKMTYASFLENSLLDETGGEENE